MFRPRRHDDGEKTVFGRTGAWGYDEVVDILFEERAEQIAAFIARKLYKEFIYAAPDETVVNGLAEILLDNDFEVAPAVGTLLGSAHFFDDQVIGARVKSPVEMIMGLMGDLDAEPVPAVMQRMRQFTNRLRQGIFNPPNVAGWPGHRAWLSTTTFVNRWNIAERVLNRSLNSDGLDLTALAATLHDPNDPEAAFTLPVALAERLLSIPLDLLDLQSDGLEFAGDLESFPLPDTVQNGPAYTRNLAKLFLAGVPWYEWSLNRSNAARLLRDYVLALTRLPEFQLT